MYMCGCVYMYMYVCVYIWLCVRLMYLCLGVPGEDTVKSEVGASNLQLDVGVAGQEDAGSVEHIVRLVFKMSKVCAVCSPHTLSAGQVIHVTICLLD